MIFKYTVNSLEETPLVIQKSLTEIEELKQSEYKHQEIIDQIPNLISEQDPNILEKNYKRINTALLKMYRNKECIILKYEKMMNFLEEQSLSFDEELEKCKENLAMSAVKIKASNIETAFDEEDDGRYCVCGGKSKGDMVACDADDCGVEWFHLECVGLSEPPKGKWICHECEKR